MSSSQNILNLKDLALWLHISESMLRKLIYNNNIPYFKIGNRYYFDRDIIQKWIINLHNEIELGGI